MAVSATRAVSIGFSGDYTFGGTFSAAINAASPGLLQQLALASGANTVTPPTGAKSVTIVPPSGNVVALTLKGVAGDTGIALHKTDPTSIGLDGAATFVINAGSSVTIVMVWT
jgi:hypothetical protein